MSLFDLTGSIELHHLCDHLCSQNPYCLKEIILFYILEIFVSSMLQFIGCIFVTNNDCVWMLLQAADSPHVVDGFFDSMTKGTGLIMAIHHNHHLFGIHDGTDTNGQSGLGNEIDIIIEETTIGNHSIGGEGLLAGAALETGAWLIEGDMAIGANASHKEVYATCCLNGFLVVLALCFQILGIAIEDMDILFLNVDVAEEVVPHEGVVTLGMFLGEVYVLVHIERDDVLEGHLAGLVQGNQFTVHAERGTACGAAEFEGLVCRRLGFVDTLGYIVCSPL